MSSITEQFSAVTKSQLEAQFQIFNTLAHTAVDSAEKLIALHLNAGKASVEKSSTAAKQLLEVKDATQLFNITRDTPTGLDSLLAYSRELFAIASGAQAELIKSTRTPLPLLPVPQDVVQPVAKAVADVAAAAVVETPVATPPAAVVAAAPEAAPVAAPVTAPAPASEPAPVATNIHDAVASTVHAAEAEPAAPPTPLAATVAPTPAADIKPGIKPSFPAPKAIPVAADNKASKLKAVPPKAKQAEIPAGKQKK